MVERNVGQMSLADGLVQAARGGILDAVEAVVDWVPLRALLVKRGGAGAGNSSIRLKCYCAVCLWGYGMDCPIPLWRRRLPIGCRSAALSA